MTTLAPRKPRLLRRFLRTFFAHRLLLVLLVVVGGALGGGVSLLQDRTYQAHLELAAAPDGAPTRVLLPDNAKLWQLVHSNSNLAMLVADAPPKGTRELERVNQSIRLEPISTQATGSSVWSLQVDIPAPSSEKAKEMLDRYASRLDSEFQQKTLLVSRRPAHRSSLAETHSDTTDRSLAPVAAHANGNAGSGAIRQTSSTTDANVAELANQLGVEPDQLPYVIDQYRESIERKGKELAERETVIESLVRAINRVESGSPGAQFPPEVEAAYPELQSVRKELTSLVGEREQLSASLKPAHPELKAVERRIAEVESKFQKLQAKIASTYESEIQRLETNLKNQREQYAVDCQRLAAVDQMLGTQQRPMRLPASLPEPASSAEATDTVVATPHPLPENLRAFPMDRPVGRVVVRAGIVDPSPVRPKTTRNILVGLVGGILAYICIVFLWAGSDQRVHGVDDLESLGPDINVFGSIPKSRRGQPVGFSHGNAL